MAWNHTQTTTERGYGASWRDLRERILLRDHGLCQVCKRAGRLTQATEVDHITPKAQQGTDDEENLQSICSPCHADKTQADAGKAVKPTIGVDGWPI